jgi:hypothetical protein
MKKVLGKIGVDISIGCFYSGFSARLPFARLGEQEKPFKIHHCTM